MKLKIERIYTKPIDQNGYRILVDRLWPRGISKVNAALDLWKKEIDRQLTFGNGSIMIQRSMLNSVKIYC